MPGEMDVISDAQLSGQCLQFRRQTAFGAIFAANDQAVGLGLLPHDLRHRPNENIQPLTPHDAPHHRHNPGVCFQPERGAYGRAHDRLLELRQIDSIGHDAFTTKTDALVMLVLLERPRSEDTRRGKTTKQTVHIIEGMEGADGDDAGATTAVRGENARFSQGDGVVQVHEVDALIFDQVGDEGGRGARAQP